MLAHVGACLSQLEPRSTHEIGAYGAGERAASSCRSKVTGQSQSVINLHILGSLRFVMLYVLHSLRQ